MKTKNPTYIVKFEDFPPSLIELDIIGWKLKRKCIEKFITDEYVIRGNQECSRVQEIGKKL